MKQGNPADIVYDYIKNQIVTKAIYPGTRIVEEDLVRETGVSRTPVLQRCRNRTSATR